MLCGSGGGVGERAPGSYVVNVQYRALCMLQQTEQCYTKYVQ